MIAIIHSRMRALCHQPLSYASLIVSPHRTRQPFPLEPNIVPEIHPSSIIDPQASLADDVIIGPGCIIDGPATLGPGTRLLGHVFLSGKVVIGANNLIYPNTSLGFAPQYRKFDHHQPTAGVSIGDDNVIREGVTIHRTTGDEHPTRIGDRNYLMCNAHLGHDVVLGHDNTLANGVLLGGHIHLDNNVTIGGNAAIHQFCRIGRMAMISGLVGIAQDVPPFCVCHGFRTIGSLNVVGLRRAGLRQHIDPLKQAFDIFFCRGHSNGVALDRIEKEVGDDSLCVEFATFIRQTKRGITPYYEQVDDDPDSK